MEKVFFIGAGPGDPELITIKGKKLIDQADIIIFAGSLVNPAVSRAGRRTASSTTPPT
jgi:precorrin-4/cobalt-precorrin-4 C11-methyltransferase